MTIRLSQVGCVAITAVLGLCAVSSGCGGTKSAPAVGGNVRIEVVPAGAEKVALDPSATDQFDVVARGVPLPGFTIYQVVIDYDESVIDMVEVQNIALQDSDPKPLCVVFSDTDYNNDMNLMAEIDCGVPEASDPQHPDDSKAKKGDVVTLARFKFKPIKEGTSPLTIVRANLRTAERKLMKLDYGEGFSVQVGGGQ